MNASVSTMSSMHTCVFWCKLKQHAFKGTISDSAVTDCRKYRLSEYSRNDTTCRLLMAMSIHQRHGKKITASLNRQDDTFMLSGITRRQPGGKFVSEVNIAHG